MKQINDIPVRRRPQSKDVNPADADMQGADVQAHPADAPRRPQRQIWDTGHDAGFEPGADVPAPKPARPRSTPLILRNSTPAEATEPKAEPAPVQAKRTVSRPRAAEPMADPTPPATAPPQGSMRPRSRPIMPPQGPSDAAAQTVPASPPAHPNDVPPAPVPQPPNPAPNGGPVNRAKTRILGFHAQDIAADPLAAGAQSKAEAGQLPAGWIVIVDGPGRGASFTVGPGVSTIGRAEDQAISLDFGDMSVSRTAHASVAYDEEQNKFFIGHGGKSNVVRRNGSPVLATEELEAGDLVRIGKTTLRFVALCGPDFSWENPMGTATEGGHG
ncbi:MAG: FHA domain-containing protein [Pseudomonadota bacterium]